MVFILLLGGLTQVQAQTAPSLVPISGQEFNMIATGNLFRDGVQLTGSGYWLATYGPGGLFNDCRSLSLVSAVGIYYSTIRGNTPGDSIQFLIWDGNTSTAYSASESLSFTDNDARLNFSLHFSSADCGATLSPVLNTAAAPGGSGTISVSAVANCAWTSTSNTPWITITSGSIGIGNGSVNYSVAPHSSGADRTGTLTIANQTFTLLQRGRVFNNDSNQDGKADIFWRNYSNGINAVWLMDGTTRLGVNSLPSAANLDWNLTAFGDMSTDNKADLIWRNYATGDNAIWVMNGTTRTSVLQLPPVTDLNMRICGVGDFNHDGKLDLVWRNYSSGANSVWLMNGTSVMEVNVFPSAINLDWRLEGVGDFNFDSKPDLIWRNYSTGANSVWFMDGITRIGVGTLPAATNLNWKLEGAADFNNDGKTDLLWRNLSTGDNAIWLMDGLNRQTINLIPNATNLSWKIGDNF